MTRRATPERPMRREAGGAALLLLLSGLLFPPGCRREDAGQTPGERLQQLLRDYDSRFIECLAVAQREMGKEVLRYSRLSDTAAIPARIDIRGSHYDYGNLLGRIARLCGRQPPRIVEGRRDLNEKIMTMYRRVCPQYLELARGLGEAFSVSMSELDFTLLEYDFMVDFWYHLFRYDEFRELAGAASGASMNTHCSLVFARVGDEDYVGRNFDDDHEKPQFVEFSSMREGYRVLANACYVPYHWVMDGVNEKGLCMGTANLVMPAKYYWTDPYPDLPAVCEHHLFRIALETCASVEEVIALYRSVRPWSHATDHLLVADAQGHSAVIEFNLERQAVFFPALKSHQIMTNIAYQEGHEYMMKNCWRYAQATAMAEEGIRSFADVERITRSICGSEHGYTSLFDLRQRSLQLYRRSDFYRPFNFSLPPE